jgi:hypothetical protein
MFGGRHDNRLSQTSQSSRGSGFATVPDAASRSTSKRAMIVSAFPQTGDLDHGPGCQSSRTKSENLCPHLGVRCGRQRENSNVVNAVFSRWWRTQSKSNASLCRDFPANREINREFRRIRLLSAAWKADRQANSVARSEIRYSAEQGIFAQEQGICPREQGI